VTRTRRVFAITFAATLLTQLAWILALPAFQGIDEFDHAYKAAAVAHGEVLAPAEQAVHGRGGVVRVPASLVKAAGPVCASYDYTGRDNCRAIRHEPGGMVGIASAASRYNPVYYAVVGTLARPFHGAAFDYAMRVFSAIGCALLLAWGAAVTARWSRDAWPMAAYALVTTPVLLYSTSVGAPNGIEYAGALLLWTSGIALARDPDPRPLLPFTVAASLMLLVHTTGALWLVIALAALLLTRPRTHWRTLVGSHRAAVGAAVLSVALVGLSCVGWVLLAHTNAPESDGPGHAPSVALLAVQNILWPLQAVAAFPMRDQAAPPVVYAALLLPLVALLVLGWRAAGARTRIVLAMLLAATVVVPTALTWLTFAELGTAWQGRYSLPLYAGLPLLAASALTGNRPLRVPFRVALVGLITLGSAVSVAHLARDVVVSRPGRSAAEALPAGWLLVGVLAALGSLMLVPLVVGPRRSTPTDVPDVQGVQGVQGVQDVPGIVATPPAAGRPAVTVP
jgi:hypothetical protein